MTHQMTQGTPRTRLLQYALPLMASGVLQQLYGIADIMIAGQLLGETAVAAIGISTTAVQCITNVLIGLCAGLTVQVSHFWGAKQTHLLPGIGFVFIGFFALVSALCCGGGWFFSGRVLGLLQTPADLLESAQLYLRITALGIPLTALYNCCCGLLRGIGDSRSSFVSILVSVTINIGLNYWFMKGLGLGIYGAALATVIAQGAAAGYAVLRCFAPACPFRWHKKMPLQLSLLGQGLKLGVPVAAQTFVFSWVSVILQGLINTMGATAITAITAAYRIDSVLMVPVTNLSTAVSVFTAQNHGAGKLQRVKAGYRAATGISVVLCLSIAGVLGLFSTQLVSIFGLTAQTAALGAGFLRVCALFYVFFGFQNVCAGVMTGLGNTLVPAVLQTGGQLLRLALTWLWIPFLGFDALACGESVCWVLCALACLFAVRHFHRGVLNLTPQPALK